DAQCRPDSERPDPRGYAAPAGHSRSPPAHSRTTTPSASAKDGTTSRPLRCKPPQTDSGPAAPPPGARKNTDDPLPKPRPLAVELDTPDPDCTADNVTSSLLTLSVLFKSSTHTDSESPALIPKPAWFREKTGKKE